MTEACPVDECGRTDLDSVGSVKMHIVATNDEAHNEAHEAKAWEALEENDNSDPDTSSGETAAAGAQSDASDGADQNDDTTTDDTTQMASQDEYKEQYQDSNDGGDQPEGDGADTDTVEHEGFTIPSFSASTVVLVAGVALAAYLVWRLYSGGSDAASQYDEPEEQADASDSEPMVDVDAGTGGVEV